MVDQSKILTVSYGTFSCTLEGFDDPFSTMRGIAEYFRDLAADDRYFGAEPPTPDAEMLHRIAEREVNKRVEARVEEDGVTLRQLGNEAPAEAVAAPAETPVEPAPHQKTQAQPTGYAMAGSVAEKLARIRALSVEDEFESGGEAYEGDPISSAFDDDADEAEIEAPVSVVELVSDEEPEEPAAEIEDTVAEDDEADATLEAEAEVDAPEVDEQFEDTDVEVANEIAAEFDDSEEEEVAEVEAAIEDEAPEAIAAMDNTSEEVAEIDTDEDGVEVDVDAEPIVELHAQSDDAEQDTLDQEDADGDTFETEGTIASIIGASLDESEEEADAQGDQMETPDGAAIARVVKMRRSDFEAAREVEETAELEAQDQVEDAADDFEDFDEIDGVDDIKEMVALTDEATEDETSYDDDVTSDDEDETSLSEADEADLMATLEQVKLQEAADMRSEKEGRAILENQDIESNDDSVTRILDVTNTELEESAGTRRRSAIAHLKAAVAATRADKLLGRLKGKDDSEEMDKYRSDLAQVVKPRRPTAPSETKTRRLAPLVLVSEQLVDEETNVASDASEAGTILPRRIRSENVDIDEDDGENIFRDGHSFADFAEEMGAKELPDLLEAAAAFSSFVEGQEHFSRPQIMKAVSSLNEDEGYSREESLRSFGLLLRRGKIKKIKRGQFTIADTTRFNPEVRAVGE